MKEKNLLWTFLLTIILAFALSPLSQSQEKNKDSEIKRLVREYNSLKQRLAEHQENEKQSQEAVNKAEHALQSAQRLNDTQAEPVARDAISVAQTALNQARAMKEEDKKRMAEIEQRLNPLCARIPTQLDNDRNALSREQKTIEMGKQELADWTSKSQEAQWDAFLKSVNLLTAGTLAYVADLDKVANGLKGAIKKYENQLARQNKPIDQFHLNKLTDLNKRLISLNTAVKSAKGLTKAKKRVDLAWGEFKATTRTMDDEVIDSQKLLQTFSDEPLFRDLLEKEALMPMVNSLKTKALYPKKPYLVTMAGFLLDYGYDATQWEKSRELIIQQYKLTDEHLKAVAALKGQIERTAEDLKVCRSAKLKPLS